MRGRKGLIFDEIKYSIKTEDYELELIKI